MRLGFPTLNMSHPQVMKGSKLGVYVVETLISDNKYFGLLYYGPRLIQKEKRNVIEIHVLKFDKSVYGETVKFRLFKFLRGVIDFAGFRDYQSQLKKDIQAAEEFIRSPSK